MGSFEDIFTHVTSIDLGSSTINTLLGWFGGLFGSTD
ncbi:hypothetical protein C8K36_10951 [Rhodococcus sp. OK519]|nr:hypothetical protein C8K36_10951 [Rhodococcus sp. OK519]